MGRGSPPVDAVKATRALAVALVLQAVATSALESQHDVRWWEAGIAVGIIGGATLFDRGGDAWIQHRRSPGSDDVARFFRHGGQPEVFFTVGGGLVLAGVVARDAGLRRRGGRILASVAIAGLTTTALKEVGRVRPADTRDPFSFRPFSRDESFPSGHATMAFAFAASLAEEINAPLATTLLYAGATGTAWSRLNDHRHWLSDVLAGATIGITTAKVIEGRWRIFGLGPPRFLIDASGDSRVEWRVPL